MNELGAPSDVTGRGGARNHHRQELRRRLRLHKSDNRRRKTGISINKKYKKTRTLEAVQTS